MQQPTPLPSPAINVHCHLTFVRATRHSVDTFISACTLTFALRQFRVCTDSPEFSKNSMPAIIFPVKPQRARLLNRQPLVLSADAHNRRIHGFPKHLKINREGGRRRTGLVSRVPDKVLIVLLPGRTIAVHVSA